MHTMNILGQNLEHIGNQTFQVFPITIQKRYVAHHSSDNQMTQKKTYKFHHHVEEPEFHPRYLTLYSKPSIVFFNDKKNQR